MDFRAMCPRHIEALLSDAWADTPVVFLNGARQTGKSTGLRVIQASGMV